VPTVADPSVVGLSVIGGQVLKPKSMVVSAFPVPVLPGSVPFASVMAGEMAGAPWAAWMPLLSLFTPLSAFTAVTASG
jgi:hypothetical protein